MLELCERNCISTHEITHIFDFNNILYWTVIKCSSTRCTSQNHFDYFKIYTLQLVFPFRARNFHQHALIDISRIISVCFFVLNLKNMKWLLFYPVNWRAFPGSGSLSAHVYIVISSFYEFSGKRRARVYVCVSENGF